MVKKTTVTVLSNDSSTASTNRTRRRSTAGSSTLPSSQEHDEDVKKESVPVSSSSSTSSNNTRGAENSSATITTTTTSSSIGDDSTPATTDTAATTSARLRTTSALAVVPTRPSHTTTSTVLAEDEEPPGSTNSTHNSTLLTDSPFGSLGLCTTLVESCIRLGWKTATQIQQQVIPEAIQGRDIIGLAETGSGKTGAFVLSILQRLYQFTHGIPSTISTTNTTTTSMEEQEGKQDNGAEEVLVIEGNNQNNNNNNHNYRISIQGGASVIILTPTRELAFQIHQVVQALGQMIGATSVCVVGGVDRTAQAIALARHPHIIIATPGRLLDHLHDTKGFTINKVKIVVLDEADRMLSLDFEEELHEILDQLPDHHSYYQQHNTTNNKNTTTTNTPPTLLPRQTLLFSATMTSQVQKLQRACLSRNHVRVEVSTKFQTPIQLIQSYLFIPAKYKDCYLTYLVNDYAGKSILIFGATCNNVQRLAIMLRNLNFPAIALHGQMNQSQRLSALNKFCSHQRSILVCTDVASRGLDLPNVDIVIQFDLPGHGKEYIHRVGRTARAGKSGQAIAMVTQYDVEVYQRIEVLLGHQLSQYNIVPEETVLILLERVNEAQRLATRELKEQLAQRKNNNGGGNNGRNGGRTMKRNQDRDYDDDHAAEGGIEHVLQNEIQNRYHNNKGSGNRSSGQRNNGFQQSSRSSSSMSRNQHGGRGGGGGGPNAKRQRK